MCDCRQVLFLHCATIAVASAMAFKILKSHSSDTLAQASLAHANQMGHWLMISLSRYLTDFPDPPVKFSLTSSGTYNISQTHG